MLKITNISIHNSGGLGNNQFASTAHLTVEDINQAHKDRWDFPSQYMTTSRGRYAGYNVIYDPKDRSFTQCRAIGEETAAQRGHNFDTFSLLVMGNFSKRPIGSPAGTVDPLTKQIEDDVAAFLYRLINGNKDNLTVVPGTVVDLHASRVRPHRFYSPTTCYGTGIEDGHFRNILIKYKPVVGTAPDVTELQERLALLQTILKLWYKLLDLRKQIDAKNAWLAAMGDRECGGII